MAEALPLFPLNTFFVPEMTLPLRVFEQRYLSLIKACIADQTCFGIVPIRDGNEVGQPAMVYQCGVEAEIVDFSADADGILAIKVQGRRKFAIRRTWVEPDQLMRAEVDFMPDESEAPIDPEFNGLEELLLELTGHPQVDLLGLPAAQTSRQLGWFLTLLLPISRAAQVDLLTQADPQQRLSDLVQVISELSRR
jgi:Lon protease-like protein